MAGVPVEVRGLERRFGARLALAGLELCVAPGESVGLVGPNGSGKTTLLSILAGLLRPSAGEARVFGLEPFGRRELVMRRARFAFAPPALFESLTAREHLVYLAPLGLRREALPTPSAIEEVLETVGLRERAGDRVHTFSFGMRQRLLLAQALLPRPELLVLDEPTEGLDPLAVLELRAVLARLQDEHGIALLLASHLLVEIDELVDRMLVLREGRALFAGTPAELCRGSERTVLVVDAVERAVQALRARGLDPRANGDGVLELEPGAIELEQAAGLLRAHGVVLHAFHLRRASLEEALLARLAGVRP